jgi:nucleotide-binding universal stress UspA family protein
MKKLLVALDGSPRELGVLNAAVVLARRTSAKLVLFRSVGLLPEVPPEALNVHPEEVPAQLERAARAALEKLAATVPEELRGGCRTAIGTAWQAISEMAAEEEADVVIIGSHGYRGLDRVLGTTAAKVVNHADRSVLVVRAPERFTAD